MGLEIKNTHKGRDWFGSCEVCKKPCDNHYMQSGQTKTLAKFGHAECLREGIFKDAQVKN